jgi:hypothetical protein
VAASTSESTSLRHRLPMHRGAPPSQNRPFATSSPAALASLPHPASQQHESPRHESPQHESPQHESPRHELSHRHRLRLRLRLLHSAPPYCVLAPAPLGTEAYWQLAPSPCRSPGEQRGRSSTDSGDRATVSSPYPAPHRPTKRRRKPPGTSAGCRP